MLLIAGVVFRKSGRTHYYSNDIPVEVGDEVICHLGDAVELGKIVSLVSDVDEKSTSSLSKIIRRATYHDVSVNEINKTKEKEGYKKFKELAGEYNLSMKLINVHVVFDRSKMIFYFTSVKRVDFRGMVKELASFFKIRIELRQIGVRDEARIVGGLGLCGMDLCCKSFLTDFQSISVKMAKDQNLPLNPLKISGICGKLMCCLNYEYDEYMEFAEKAPEVGVKVECSQGSGIISGYESLKKCVIVEFENESKVSVPLAQIKLVKEASDKKNTIGGK